MYSDAEGQGVLAFYEPACEKCPYWLLNRCRGPTTGSVLPATIKSIGCTDTTRQLEAYYNLQKSFAIVKPPPCQTLPPLPQFIPELLRGMPAGWQGASEGVYAISLSSLVTSIGAVRYGGDPQRLRQALHLPTDAKILLIGTADDELLELFWEQSERRDSWHQLSRFGFCGATGLAFSVWDNDPRYDQIHNQRRNVLSYEILTALGIPTIPFLFPIAPEDYDEVAEWVYQRREISVIADLAQFYNSSEEFGDFLSRVERLREAIGRPLRHLLVGVGTADKIERVRRRLGTENAIIVTEKPVYKAVKGAETAQLDLSFAKPSSFLNRGRLVEINIQRYRNACRRAARA